jgi:hypothetical protein
VQRLIHFKVRHFGGVRHSVVGDVNNILIDVVPRLSCSASVVIVHLKVAFGHSHIYQTSSSEKLVTTQYPLEVPNMPQHDRLYIHTFSDYKAYRLNDLLSRLYRRITYSDEANGIVARFYYACLLPILFIDWLRGFITGGHSSR